MEQGPGRDVRERALCHQSKRPRRRAAGVGHGPGELSRAAEDGLRGLRSELVLRRALHHSWRGGPQGRRSSTLFFCFSTKKLCATVKKNASEDAGPPDHTEPRAPIEAKQRFLTPSVLLLLASLKDVLSYIFLLLF